MYFVGTRGGVCRDCDLLSHSNCESGGSGHVAVGEKRPARRSRCSELRACGRVSAIHLFRTIKPPCYLLTLRFSWFLSLIHSFPGTWRKWAHISTIATMKSFLLAARRRIVQLSVQGHSYFCIISLLFSLSFFKQEKIKRPFRRPSAPVVATSATSPSPWRSFQYQSKIIASSWDHLPKLRIIFICLCELINSVTSYLFYLAFI